MARNSFFKTFQVMKVRVVKCHQLQLFEGECLLQVKFKLYITSASCANGLELT